MVKLEKYVKNKICKIIVELKKEDYNISKNSMLRMLNIVERTKIIYDPNIAKNAVTERIPEQKNNRFIINSPNLYMKKATSLKQFDCILYHEICHLLAIGDWIQKESNQMIHITGVSDLKYIYEGEDIFQEGEENETLCEGLNDWVAEKLYEEIENQEYLKPRSLKDIGQKLDNEINKSYKEMIGYYFNNDLNNIERLLTTKEFKSLAEIDKYYEENKKNRSCQWENR